MDAELTEENHTAASVVLLAANQRRPSRPDDSGVFGVSFDRHELRDIFDLYGRKVANGEWRDYAISITGQKAVFSIYRQTAETPLYKIEKAREARQQGAYSVVAATGLILKRGHELKRVIGVLDKRLRLVSG